MSHGVARTSVKTEVSAESRRREKEQIEQYRQLVDEVQSSAEKHEFSAELFEKTSALLMKNPEYYTIWNVRREIFENEFESLSRQVRNGDLTSEDRASQILSSLKLDLGFLLPLLMKFPKCYWIWNHRLWLLQQSTLQLPAETSRSLWEEELGLVGQLLNRDSRNFHGWGYRRIVVDSLESSALNGQSLARSEHEYTTKMIGINLSNFSAWHTRSRLILRILEEQQATDAERKDMLDKEFELIHKALFDPYDQSLWFYHQNLMCSVDPATSADSITPALSLDARLSYVEQEKEFITDLLEDAEDCKWVYQALIDCAMIEGRLQDGPSAESRAEIEQWLQKLLKLDPLRAGRWSDALIAIRDSK